MTLSRRRFLGASAAAVMTAGIMTRGNVFGANNRIGVCVAGINGQGNSHIRDVTAEDDAEVLALCDVDQRVLERRAAELEQATGRKPKMYRDIRDALADDEIDAVSIATTNHWHALMSIWACQAGKDVFVEKPLSHNIWEGRQLVAAAEQTGRVVQHGTQSRCNATLIRDINLIHEGFIGNISHSRGYVFKNGNRHAIGHGENAQPPAFLDWTLWQGPAQEAPFQIKRGVEPRTGHHVHYDWHWFWEYGNGEIGNQGVHEMDIALWGHGRSDLPVYVQSTGGRYAWDDDGETPNTQATAFRFADGSMLTFEVRNLGSFHEADARACGNSFFGETGYYVHRKGFFDYENNPIPVEEPEPPTLNKFAAFFKAMRTRNPEDNMAPPLVGHLSCVLCHAGNVAYRLGRSLDFDSEAEKFKDDEANTMLAREYREGFEVPQLA